MKTLKQRAFFCFDRSRVFFIYLIYQEIVLYQAEFEPGRRPRKRNMGRWKSWLWVILAVAAATGAGAATETVEGRIELVLADGQTAHGDWIRVLLVTEAIDAAKIAAAARGLAYEPGEPLNRIHLDFYKAVAAKINADPEYVAASTLTTEDGTFKFTAVPPGRYWVLITFPAMVGGCKVAWQVPVTAAAYTVAQVVLNNANLLFALPPRRAAPDLFK
jgi:hypothetical protein